ncbi:MAG TPA: Ig-like domain-containing protein, partial [Candidatus Wallbacteria bacterium]|nr:Ig-like domain-containing protein [Candidatus Wallbacteria bacterium]
MKKHRFNFISVLFIFIFISFCSFEAVYGAEISARGNIERNELQVEKLSEVSVQIEEPDVPHEVTDHNARMPFVIKTKPLDAETDVSINSQIKIMFNKPMDYLSINLSSIMVMDEVGSVIEGTISYDSSSYTATFTPRTILSKNTLYSLFIPSYLIKDTEGNPLDKNVTLSFRTESKSEVTKIYENRKSPKVIKTYPDDKATDVSLDTYIIADFNLALLGSRVNEDAIKLNDGARDIDGKTVYSDKERQILFVPGKNLEYGKVYRVTLSSMQIESVHGFKMPQNYSWTFSTKKPRDEAPPEVLSTSPIDGSYDVSEQARISVTFSEEIDPVSLNKYTIILSDGNQDVPGKITYDKRTSKAAFFPLEKLKSGQKYTMLISNGVKDIAGNAMQSPREWTFTTKKPVIVEKPRIVKTYPADREKEIKPDSKIFVYFNKVMNESTCNVFNIKLSGNSKTSAITTSFVKNGNFVTIIPLENFEYSTEYKVSLSARITDLEGQTLESDYSFAFTTMNKPDIVSPEIVRVTPDDGALNVPLNSVISIRFSEPVSKSSITAATVSVKNEKGLLVKGYTQYEDDQNILTFIPESRFEYLTKYVVTVADSIKDFANNRLKASKIWTFSTVQAPDTTAPRVISCLPVKGEQGIDVKTAVQVIFSEKLAEGAVSSKTFQLYDSNGGEVSSAVTYDQIMKRVTITPRRDLEFAMVYKVVVSKLVSDLAGNYMKATYISDFKTVSAPDRTRPELSSTCPEAGAINVPLNTPISAAFTKHLDPLTVTGKNVFLRDEN